MFRTTLRGLLAHKVRLALTALAVVLGVAFVSGTMVLTDTMNSTFDTLFDEINAKISVQVRSPSEFRDFMGNEDRTPLPESVLAEVRAVPGVDAAEGVVQGYAQLVSPRTGKAIVNGQAPTFGLNWPRDPSLSSLRLADGRPPRAPGEVAVDIGTAEEHDVSIGDRVRVLLPGRPVTAEVVGTFRFGTANSLAGATLTAFEVRTAQAVLDRRGEYDVVVARAADGVSDASLKQRITAALGAGRYEVLTGGEAADQGAQSIQEALGFFETALLVFAGIALFVGAFIIFNTFTILVAQRTRELALLRALGASRRQVLGSVLTEALAVGLLSAALGFGGGVATALGLRQMLGVFGVDLPAGSLVVEPSTLAWSLVVGVGVTCAAAVLPARRAAAVPPVAAMREAVAPATGRSLRRRLLVGSVLTAAGVALLALGLLGAVGNAALTVGLGAAATFYGVAALSPLLAPPVVRAVGAPLLRLLRGGAGRSGVTRVATAAELGRQNALRNPRRTASTAAALMVGLALVSAVSVLASSIKQSTSDLIDRTLGADFVLSADRYLPISGAVAADVAALPEVAAATPLRSGMVRIGGSIAQMAGTDPAAVVEVIALRVDDGSLAELSDPDTIAISRSEAKDRKAGVGDELDVEFAALGHRTLRVVAVFEDNPLLGDSFVTLAAHERYFSRKVDSLVLVAAKDSVAPKAARAALERVTREYPNVQVKDQAQLKRDQQAQVDQLLNLITALLLLSVLIAVLGIMNTLALSVFERTRELGLVRAIGMSRRQVRTMVRYESVVIALFGAVLGLALGTVFGWALVQAFRDEGLTVLVVPVGRLLFYVALAGVFGVVAAIWPARRAARLDVLRAIAYE